jgi:hypothetical protein
MQAYVTEVAAEFGLTSTPATISADLAEVLEVHEQITQKRTGDKPVPRGVKSTTPQSSGVRVPEQPALTTDPMPATETCHQCGGRFHWVAMHGQYCLDCIDGRTPRQQSPADSQGHGTTPSDMVPHETRVRGAGRQGSDGMECRKVNPSRPAGVTTDSTPPAEAARDAFRETVRLCQGAGERLKTIAKLRGKL